MRKQKLLDLLEKIIGYKVKMDIIRIKFFPILILLIYIIAMGNTLINKFSESYKINNLSNKVYFCELNNSLKHNNAIEIDKPYLNREKTIINNINVKLTDEKDLILYNVMIINNSKNDKKINIIPVIDLPKEQQNLLDIKYYYSDGTEFNSEDVINAKQIKEINIIIKYMDNLDEINKLNLPNNIKGYFMLIEKNS